jgi:hypothetical protein
MIRAAFPLDRRPNASMIPTTAVNPVRPIARSDQSCAPSLASVPPAETVRGSWCRRSADSLSCRRGDPWFAARARAVRPEAVSACRPSSGTTDSDPSGLIAARSTVLSDDVCVEAVGSTALRCRCGASTPLAVTGVSATAGVACSVATGAGRAAAALVAAVAASLTGGALSACADSAATGETTSATGADPAAGTPIRGGNRVKGST